MRFHVQKCMKVRSVHHSLAHYRCRSRSRPFAFIAQDLQLFISIEVGPVMEVSIAATDGAADRSMHEPRAVADL